MKMIDKEKLNEIGLFVSILSILNENSMTETDIRKAIYAGKNNICEVSDEIILVVLARLFDGNCIELVKVEQGESLLRITEQGKDGYNLIMGVVDERLKENDG